MIKILNFDITNRCVMNCRGCYKGSGKETGFIGLEKMKQIMKEAKILGASADGFSGGEPGLVPERLLDCLKLGSKYFKYQGVLTTGFNINSWLEEALKYNLTFVQISLDGNKKYHNWYRKNPKAFDYAIAAIKLCEGKVKLRVNYVLTNKNLNDLSFILDFAREHKVELRISPIVPLGKESKELLCSPVDISIALATIQKHGKNVSFSGETRLDKPFKIDVQFGLKKFSPELPFNCQAGQSAVKDKCLGVYPVITETGDVKMCSYLSIIGGNINERSFTDIYLHPKNYDAFFKAKPLNKICANCLMRGICIQVCRAVAYMYDGVFDYPDEPPERCVLRKQGLLEKRKEELWLASQ